MPETIESVYIVTIVNTGDKRYMSADELREAIADWMAATDSADMEVVSLNVGEA